MNPGRRTPRQTSEPMCAPRGCRVTPATKARLAATAVLGAALLAAGCGGGTSQFEPFLPDEYLAFGDESSLILPDGRRYTVNPLGSTGAIDCRSEPIWSQAVAGHYSFVFQECNPDGATEFKARMRATAGAKVADFKAQIDAQVARGGFAAKSLATVMVGANDVFELYEQYPRLSEAQITDELRARGIELAAQINRLVGLGPRVIVSTLPDLGLTPYALAQKSTFTDTDRAALLSRLTAAFNARLRVNVLNDGRFIGLVLADEATLSISRAATAFGISDAVSAVCTAALPDCTSGTLVASGSSAQWLWADAKHLAYGGHLRVGTLAVARAANNPF